MSIQERDRKHIMYGFIAMLILTFMCGCSGMQIQYPDERMQEMLEETLRDSPSYRIDVNEFDRYELSENNQIKSCGYITKIKSANYCQINVAKNSVRALRVNLNACVDDDFNGYMPKVRC